MGALLRAYDAFFGIFHHLSHFLLLFMRVWWGYLFFEAGKGKFYNLQGTVDFFTSLGIPFPDISTYLVTGIEAFGGLLLIVGLFSRLSALPMVVTMVSAYALAHQDALVSFSAFVAATPFMYLVSALMVLIWGPGLFSLDYFLRKRY